MFSWANQVVLLTGGTGFLGRNMQQALAPWRAQRCEVYAPARLLYNLTLQRSVEQMIKSYRPTVMVHMAGLVGGIGANVERPADFFYQNLMMGALLMHEARLGHVKKFVAVGAGCGYPEYAPIPTKETSLWDGYPQAPSAPYSLAKRMLVVQAQAMHEQYDFQAVVGMPGNLYGKYDNFSLENGHVIPALVRKFVEAVMFGQNEVVVWGSGKASRDFVYASDVCEGLIRIAEAYDGPELVNLSSGVESSIAEVVELLIKITAYNGRVIWDTSKPDGQLRRAFDISKAKSIGWEPRVNLADGLEQTVCWFRDNYDKVRK
jgi:GDP-L-fucose synthase